MTDLFTYTPERYPQTAGYKRSGTSADAAEAVKPRVPKLRQLCLSQVRAQPCTADECARWLGESVLAIRPRFSELTNLGQIIDTGARRPNSSGRMATVWGVAA